MTLLLMLTGYPSGMGLFLDRQRLYYDYTEWEKRRFEEQLITIMAGWLA